MNKNLFKLLPAILIAFGTVFTFTSCSEDESNEVSTGTTTTTLKGNIGTRTLSEDTIYIIDGFAYVDSNDILIIEAGTIIKANTGDGANASALIITRGGKIMANGTAAKPIIFTSVNDNITIGQTASTLLPAQSTGLWGGIIVLGSGLISARASKGSTETDIEGVPPALGISKYGGNVENDNSGKLNYVSIRFTGTKLATDDEIQGLTLGGVGSGTTVTNIEVISSADDGIEFFGGSVNVTNAVIAYQADDGLDIDQSYSGTISEVQVLVYNSEGNDAFEIDGPEGNDNATGKFTIQNVTVANNGGGTNFAATFKSDAQGNVNNCAFDGFTNWVRIQGDGACINYNNDDLVINGGEFSFDSLPGLITADTLQNEIETKFVANNTATSSFSKGATADFSWTWSSDLNILAD